MQDTSTLKASTRQGRGSTEARRTREQGKIPAVIYGEGGEAVSIAMDAVEVTNLLRHHTSEHIVTTVTIDNEAPTKVLIQDIQHETMSRSILHMDLMRLSATRKITLPVRIELIGEAEGVKMGGVLEHLLHEVEVECLPDAVPEVLEIDVTALNIGDNLSLSDITPPVGVVILGDPDIAIAAVATPRLASDDAAEEETAIEETPEAGE